MAKKSNQAVSAGAFVERWSGKGYEKGETQRFWLDLLSSVFGVQNPTTMMEFEVPVKTITKEKGSDFIDGYIKATKVLIEQKSSKVDLAAKAKQSDGAELTPYQQARRYAAGLPVSMTPRWIVVCNFDAFEIHDMERPTEAPEVVMLSDLEKEYYRLTFLVDDISIHTKKEVEVSMAAGRIIGEIYDAFLKEYKNPGDPHSLRSLNILCVRLVFCLYAEDAGLFDSHSQFHDYLAQFKAGTGEMRKGLLDLFDVLNTPVAERDPYLRDDLMAFPYVNGGLFAEKDIEVPRFNERIATLLLKHASDDFDWSEISPTIFGGVFESTLNPETRRAGGMHYTSIENIHKVIDPLFLDDLKKDLADIKAEPSEKKRIAKAREFQDRLAGLKFLDPACGSGNFLTETFISLRRLENEALRIIYKGQMVLGDLVNPIKVSIGQFFGIEINDFAVSVSMTALWIAEAQMLFETEKIIQMSLEFLPLKSYTNIHEGNALRMDWNDVISACELNYIMGNPPFVGYDFLVASQQEEMQSFFGRKTGRLDYVTAWFIKAAQYIQGRLVRCAFVATNSISQGVQVPDLWLKMFRDYDIHIDYAYKTFQWDSEAALKAHVHCIIVGFSNSLSKPTKKYLYNGDDVTVVRNISPYLIDAPSVIVERRTSPLNGAQELNLGSLPKDGGGFILSEEEANLILKKEPLAEKWIKPYIGATEFINRKVRYCLWMVNANPSELRQCPTVMDHIDAVRKFRLASKAESTRALAESPTLFAQIAQPDSSYVLVPRTSSGRRKYVPMGYMDSDQIASDAVQTIKDATLTTFGILMSRIHNLWLDTVGGKLKSDYRYSKDIVYNTFPWPSCSDVQDAKIEATAQAILDARALYPDSSLADLYDDLTMPIELRKAHRANDAAVMEAYGFRKDMTEAEIVAELFKMYQKLTEK